MIKEDTCRHMRQGRILARHYTDAASRSHAFELLGQMADYRQIRLVCDIIRDEMDKNVVAHRDECDATVLARMET